MTSRRLQNRHVVVTGAGTGIGRAVALRLAAEGARLSVMARRPDPIGETARLAGMESGAPAVAICCDVRDRASVDAAFARAAAENGPIYALIANAGIGGSNEDGPDDRFDDIVATNLSGTYYCLRAAQRHIAEGPGARHLLAVSSILARFGVPGYTGYCASKAALLGLVRALAVEIADQGIHVNALCPGWVDTEMARSGIRGMATAMGTDFETARAAAMSVVPLGRMSTPAEIAGLVAFLISDEGRGITGQGIDMNNGAWMG